MSQRIIDDYSYQCGVIDCFNEMVHAGLKQLAMSHPCRTKEERDSYLPFCRRICERYQTMFYPEDEPFLTDLFPEELNRDTYNILFFRTKNVLEQYLALKEEQRSLKQAGVYENREDVRCRIAQGFGRLLSYPDEAIDRLIRDTKGKA